MKKNYLTLILLFFVMTSCDKKAADYKILYGFWEASFSRPMPNQKFIINFYEEAGNINCKIHSYNNGMKYSSLKGSNIKLKGTDVSFIVNKEANVCYKGKLDIQNLTIKGKLIYANGSKQEYNLKKIPNKNLEKDFPGLSRLLSDNDKIVSQSESIDDGWMIGTLKESMLDTNLLNEMVESIKKNEFGKVHSVLIAEKGQLVFEKYFDGFYTNDLHMLQSCNKSIGSLLTGIAIENGYIKDVEQKVNDFFPEYTKDMDTKWDQIKLKHLLTMSVGLNWERDVHDRIYEISDDVIATTLQQKFAHEPGELFEYRNPQTDLISGIILNTSKGSVQDFANKYLFEPLAIKNYYWPNFKSNNYCLMSGSLALSSRDMLKIGQLVLNKGQWNGKQIVSEDWINESTSFKFKTDQGFNYGYLWWLGESKTKPGLKAIVAIGISGQHILIIPEKELVVVTTADSMDEGPNSLLTMIDEYIIKGIK